MSAIDSMTLSMAPMEGITRYLFRNAQAEVFGGFDKYYTPFLSPNMHHHFRHRESDDIDPKNNAGLTVIPQIMTNVPEDFLWAAWECAHLGYPEVNLNLGCPAATVARKTKGSGFLTDLPRLERFLDAIFSETPVDISIKTRLGWADPAEFDKVLKLYEQFPVKELIVHARVREEFYEGEAHRDIYEHALLETSLPLAYNGDIFTKEDALTFAEMNPRTTQLMIGRGMLRNPAIAREIRGGSPMTNAELREFYQRVHDGYLAVMENETHVLFKCKELWTYLITQFPEEKKAAKALKKANKLAAFDAVVEELLTSAPLSHR
ncbi:MAG: tRNA-dihydrouridine synthase family protein [Lachnospiraceae bacterium]|nr:tRNA-dihydrouridine synthase family protein [Lachnospiraceae bacterium]